LSVISFSAIRVDCRVEPGFFRIDTAEMPRQAEDMTEHVTYKELRRSQSDRMVAGVCGGLGRYFDVNPTFYRVGFVVLTLLGGAGLLIYGAAVLVMPAEGRDESIVEEALREHRDRPARLLGIGLAAIAGIVLLSHARLWPHGDFAWGLLLLAGLALLASRRHLRRTAPPAADWSGAPGVGLPPVHRRTFSLTLAALGLLVIAAGALGALSGWGVDIPWAVALAVAAVSVGVALIGGAFLQLRVGGLVIIGFLLGVAAILASTINVHLNDGIGDRTFTPGSASALRHDYRLGIGNLQVDLARVSLPAGETDIEAHLGIGQLRVIVPAGISVRVESHVGWGDSAVLGEDQNGHRVDSTVIRDVKASNTTLVLDARVGAGQIEVERAPR
jgi:phage shock protein PspC (stress-responsive transcriptional regulator)